MSEILKNILKPYYMFLRLMFKLNIIKTIYINFRKLPFKQAIRLPIYVYGRLKIDSLEGKIHINHPIKSGLIKIGNDINGVPSSFLRTRICLTGSIQFNGYAIISKGASINVHGELIIGNYCTIGSGTFIKCMMKITLKDHVRITYDCTVFDSEMHYLLDKNTNTIKKNTNNIMIGNNVWVNAHSIVGKGTVIPDFSVVARGTLMNKDYSQYGPYSLFVGTPARVLDTKVQRILSIKIEIELNNYFSKNTNETELRVDKNFSDDYEDNKLFFEKLY